MKKTSTLGVPQRGIARTSIPQWGAFDLLYVRAIDDLPLVSPHSSTLIALSTAREIEGWHISPLPTQIALERFFFHLGVPQRILIDPNADDGSRSEPQQGLPVASTSGRAEYVIERPSVPYLIGGCERGFPKRAAQESELLTLCEENQLFSLYYEARRLRIEQDSRVAWFYELLALSFLGLPEEALALYEAYPHRGSAVPDVQFINARYRSLLKQNNEARTLLHALSLSESDYSILAKKELARSFVSTNEFDRAQDLADGVLSIAPNDSDALLLRGMSLRGIGYPTGEEETLRSALQAFEGVAQLGGFNSPEALFHSGVVFARLGALREAELVFRQSLFQRDRYATRESLIRVLASLGEREQAIQELDILSALRPAQAASLKVELTEVLKAPATSAVTQLVAHGRDAEEHAARELLSRWEIPCTGSVNDLVFFDSFINYYAPSGAFSDSLKYRFLRGRERTDVARALSLCIGGALCRSGVARWGDDGARDDLLIELTSADITIPLQRFVIDRISLGAGGDEQSNLQSLLSLPVAPPTGDAFLDAIPPAQTVSSARRSEFEALVTWTQEVLQPLKIELSRDLNSLPVIDALCDQHFDPGGEPKSGSLEGVDIARLMDGLGVHVAFVVDSLLRVTWFDHPEVEGIRLEVAGLGSLWPVARVHTRAFFGAAVDAGSRLTGMGLGVATAHLYSKIKEGAVPSVEAGVELLTGIYAPFASFDPEEVAALVENAIACNRTNA